jgi:hypothetical protein
MRYIVFTGCSYGQQARAFHDLQNLGYCKDVKFYNLQGSSLGSKYQLMSAINAVEKLINNGVSVDDIYVVCQWSSMFRVTTMYDIDFFENFSFFTLDFDMNTWRTKNNDTLYSVGFDKFGFVNVANQYNIIQSCSNKNLRNFLLDNLSHSSPSERAAQYHFDIINLQNYLKVKNIKYSFLFFNSALTGFNFDRTDSFLNGLEMVDVEKIKGVEKIIEDKNERFILPKIWRESIIYNKNKWASFKNLIDWGNFILYNNDRIEFGGIDEFVLENIGTIGYLSYNVKPVSFGDHLNQYGDFRYIIDSGLFEKVNKEFINDKTINVSEFKNIKKEKYEKLCQQK